MIDLFDAVVGWNGAASVDGWQSMTFGELVEQVMAQDEHYYHIGITEEEAGHIACAIILYKLADDADSGWHVRALLGAYD